MAFTLRKLDPHEMGTGGITRTLLVLAIPAALSGLLATTYDFVDRLFVTWLGTDQVSGVGLALPVLFFVYAIGMGVGIGVSVLVARRLGQRRPDEARGVLDQALLVAFIVGGAISIAGPFLARSVVESLAPDGASETVLTYATLFLQRIILTAALIHVTVVADAALRAQGNTVTGMRIMVLTNILNFLLVGFFVFGATNTPTNMPHLGGLGPLLADLFTRFGLNLGVQGAATVTLITRALALVLFLAALGSHHSQIHPSNPLRTRPRLHWRTLGEIYWLGLPMSIAMFSMGVAVAAINALLVKQHEETAVGLLVIANSIEMYAFVPIFSLGSAAIPIIAYNLGAGAIDRCRRVIFRSCVIGSVVMTVPGVVLFCFPRPILAFFTTDPAMLDMGVDYLRINSWSYFIIGIDIMLSCSFQGLGRSVLSMIAQLIRTLIVKVPAAWLLSLGFGVTGVWISSPVSTIACFIVASAIMVWLLRRIGTQGPAAIPAAPEPVPAPTDNLG